MARIEPEDFAKLVDNKREARTADFWRIVTDQALGNESERLKSIREGFSPTLFLAVREIFQLQDKQVEALFNMPSQT